MKDIKSPEALAEAHYLIGGSQIELKQFDAAVKSLAESLAAAPKWRQADETLLALAHAYSQAGHLDKAKETVGKLIAEFPESKVLDRATLSAGRVRFRRRRLEGGRGRLPASARQVAAECRWCPMRFTAWVGRN